MTLLERVADGARVLELGCGDGAIGRALHARGCTVTGIDAPPDAAGQGPDAFIPHDLGSDALTLDIAHFTHILLLDVVEHVPDPEAFVSHLKDACKGQPDVIVTTGNVAFIVVRLMLLLRAFNYGSRGILDRTHKRLFTFRSARQLFEERGFRIEEVRGIPAPFPLALGAGPVSNALLRFNRMLIRILPGLFAYQILIKLRPLPSLRVLLENAVHKSRSRADKQPTTHPPDPPEQHEDAE